MKNIIYKAFFLLPLLAFVSCQEETPGKYEMTDGVPTVHYIRYQDKDLEEQLLEGAFMNENIVIIGENLTSIREVWFNNVKAALNINFITKNTLFCAVPRDLPSVRTDKMYLVTGKNDTVAYDFEVKIPAPVLSRIKCEMVPEGGLAVLTGDYFLAPDLSLIHVFIGDYEVPTADIVSCEKNSIVFKAPAMDIRGAVEVKTLYGNSGRSKDIFHDDRGWITGFEEGFVGGWGRPTHIENDPELALMGNYVKLSGDLAAGTWVSGGNDYTINIWGEDNGVPSGNLFPGDPATATLKFEVNVLQPWSGMPLIVCFFEQGYHEDWLWNSDYPRAFWTPWRVNDKVVPYVTDGWETLSIPLADCRWSAHGTAVPLATHYGALGFSVHTFGNYDAVVGEDCSPIILIDNIRVIP
ncbi:MAG: glycan-binding surface protein [Dysgonamonadaceae bacterium]|jgi:hypothetical protein|nr:glycan-binding surface protein [Dysgonamonadaceae bacterium]